MEQTAIEQEFIEVCKAGNLENAIFFVEQHQAFDIECAFPYACEYGRLEVAKWLLQLKPSINISNSLNILEEYAFSKACANGHLEVAQWLYQIKPKINVSAESDYPFGHSCENGHLNVAQWLLTIKPTLNMLNYHGHAFTEACSNGHYDIVVLIIEHSKQYKKISKTIYSYGFSNALSKGHMNIVELILQEVPTVTIKRDDVIAVCSKGNLDVLKWIVHTKNVKIPNDAFDCACIDKQLHIAQWIYSQNPKQKIPQQSIDYMNMDTEKYSHILNWIRTLPTSIVKKEN